MSVEKPIIPPTEQWVREQDDLHTKILNAYAELFPVYSYQVAEMAIDLMRAEILACHKERDEARQRIHMPKVTQMLDAGWSVAIWKNPMGSYSAEAKHINTLLVRRVQERILDKVDEAIRDIAADDMADDMSIITDDFTPEQSLTRLAYKVHGEII